MNRENILVVCLNRTCRHIRLVEDQESLLLHKQHIVDCVASKYWAYMVSKEQKKIQLLFDKVKQISSINQIEKQQLQERLNQMIEKYSERRMNSLLRSEQKDKVQSILLDCYNNQIERSLIGIVYDIFPTQETQIILQIINEIYSTEDMKYLALSFYQKGEILQFVGREQEAIECYNYVMKIINEEKQSNNQDLRKNNQSSENQVTYV